MLNIFKYTTFILGAVIAIVVAVYFINPDVVQETAMSLLYPTVTIHQEHQDTFTVEVPAVYELMYIACSLTETFQKDDNLINTKPSYYDEITSYFQKYQNHPLVALLEQRLKENSYSQVQPTIRFFSLNYDLDQNNNLLKNEVFHVNSLLVWVFKDEVFNFSAHEALVEDFAKQTNFYAFYQDHLPYYDHLISNYQQLCDFQGMWHWLEARFEERYHSYRIIFSPLTGGFHNTIPGLKDPKKNIKQTWMFVSAPPEQIDTLSIADFEIEASKAARRVFTEIDHNYVNPLSDQFEKQIIKVMPDYRQWNQQIQGYRSSMTTFNEYMTWGVFSLYAIDTYSSQRIDSIISIQSEFMVKRRGFHRFDEFNRQLIQLYKNNVGEEIKPLYEPIIEWMAKSAPNIVQPQAEE